MFEKKEKKRKRKKITMEIVATNVVASRPPNGDRLQRRPLVPTKIKLEKMVAREFPEACPKIIFFVTSTFHVEKALCPFHQIIQGFKNVPIYLTPNVST